MITNDSLKGKKTILYFYPRDNTPTCTTEACDFRDNLEMFSELDVAVYGISGDSKKKHQNFIEKHGLNFDLLVDDEFELSKEVGVYQLKKSFGKESMGIVRTTFVIDEEGKVLDVIEKVKVKTQIEELKNILG
ncbi:peroxiredoxin [Staphylococcus argenteus]|nr:peroxiredoxin [Staphylococcus argenteus]